MDVLGLLELTHERWSYQLDGLSYPAKHWILYINKANAYNRVGISTSSVSLPFFPPYCVLAKRARNIRYK